MTARRSGRVVKSSTLKEKINKNLCKIKDLLLENMQANNEDISQIKNSDILELTLRHIRKFYETSFEENFFRGYVNATNEVSFALSYLPDISESDGNKIIAHLENQLTNAPSKVGFPAISPSSGYGSDCESTSSDVWRPW